MIALVLLLIGCKMVTILLIGLNMVHVIDKGRRTLSRVSVELLSYEGELFGWSSIDLPFVKMRPAVVGRFQNAHSEYFSGPFSK